MAISMAMNRHDTAAEQIKVPVSLASFGRAMGISSPTIWRMRNRGWLHTVNISGRPYVLPEHQAEFIRRAAAGEFAKAPHGACKKVVVA